MAVLTNTMLQGSSAATAAGDTAVFEAKKSLRIAEADQSYMQHTQKKGNTRVSTWSCWIKKADIETWSDQYGSSSTTRWLWSFDNDADDYSHFYWQTGYLIIYDSVAGAKKCDRRAAVKVHDTSEWFNIVVHYDTCETNTWRQRCEIFVNGRKIDTGWHSGGNNLPSHNQELNFNKEGIRHRPFNYSYGNTLGNSYNDCYISEYYWIDGLKLSPAAFGKFDSTGQWIPQEFSLPAPNDGTTWSDSVTYSGSGAYSGQPATNGFDGNFDTQTGPAGTWDTVEFTPPGDGIPVKAEIEVCSNYNDKDLSIECWIDGVNQNRIRMQGSGKEYKTIFQGAGNLTKIKFWASTGKSAEFNGIRIDGEVLVDGKKNVSTRKNPNRGITWSSGTASGVSSDADHLFDGDISSYVSDSGGANSTWSITLPSSIPDVELVEMRPSDSQPDGAKYTCVIGGTTYTYTVAGGAHPEWVTVYSGDAGTLTAVGGGRNSNNQGGSGRAVKVNGHYLLDGAYDNSLYLNFKDSTEDDRIGWDAWSDKSILKQSAFNATYNSGNWAYNTDANASSLVFAYPAQDLTDHSAAIKGSGSAKSITYQGNAKLDSTKVRFYGKALKVDGSGDYLEIADSTDWDFGTDDFTVELWLYPSNTSGYVGIIGSRDSTGWGMMYAPDDSYKLKFYTPTERASGNNAISTNVWQHVAVSRSGSTIKGFVNGLQVFSHSDSAAANGDASLKIGTGWPSGMSDLNGYIEDIRIYKGAAVYTNEFQPPDRNDCLIRDQGNNAQYTFTADRGYPTDYITKAELTSTTLNYTENIKWIFDGTDFSGYNDRPTGNYISFSNCNLPTASTAVKVLAWAESGNLTYKMDGGSRTDMPGTSTTKEWKNLGTGKLVELGCYNGSGSHGFNIYGIEVDGVRLISVKHSDVDTTVDSPSKSSTVDTGKGGQVPGNYPIFNPNEGADNVEISQGGLVLKGSGNHNGVAFTHLIPNSGKWYFEITDGSGSNDMAIGVKASNSANATEGNGFQGTAINFIRGNGWKYVGGNNDGETEWSGFGGYSEGQTVGVAIDMDNGAWYTRKPDGTWTDSGDPTSGSSKTGATFTDMLSKLPSGTNWVPWMKVNDGDGHTINFGQKKFILGDAPTDYKCLCSTNYPDTLGADTANNNLKHISIRSRHGGGTTQYFDFPPSLVLEKGYPASGNAWYLFDAIRGDNQYMHPNTSSASASGSGSMDLDLTNNKFTVSSSFDWNATHNVLSVAWNVGSSAATASTEGSITPAEQWVNTEGGMSITKFVGDGASDASVGHGLSVKPSMIIIKNYDASANWKCWVNGMDSNKLFNLNGDNGPGTSSWTEPNNTVFKPARSGDTWLNGSGNNYIAYCFADIEGLFRAGVYYGNGSATRGPYIHTNFLPQFVFIKKWSDSANWRTLSSVQYENVAEGLEQSNNQAYGFNENNTENYINTNSGMGWGGEYISLDAGGFKIVTTDGLYNTDNTAYSWFAWGERPFKNGRS